MRSASNDHGRLVDVERDDDEHRSSAPTKLCTEGVSAKLATSGTPIQAQVISDLVV